MRSVQIVIAALCVGIALAGSATAEQDHPLLTRYPGSELTKAEAKDFGTYTMIVGKPTACSSRARPSRAG